MIVVGAAVHTIVETAKLHKVSSKLAFVTKVAESYRKQMKTMIQVIESIKSTLSGSWLWTLLQSFKDCSVAQ